MTNALTDREAEEMGLEPMTYGGQLRTPLDNPMVEEMLANGRLPQTDKEGRPIISFSQYLRLRKKGNLSNYAMWMSFPGKNGAKTMQASKYRKYFGQGYEAVGAPQEYRHTAEELIAIGMEPTAAIAATMQRTRSVRAVPAPVDDGIVLFYCRDKYPECKRVFDNASAIKLHQGKDHGENPNFGKAARARRAKE